MPIWDRSSLTPPTRNWNWPLTGRRAAQVDDIIIAALIVAEARPVLSRLSTQPAVRQPGKGTLCSASTGVVAGYTWGVEKAVRVAAILVWLGCPCYERLFML
ncbi:hypothetical protein JRQ81_003391 [Phrynocephalus forsythii]|uniref:Uncharacterized protein n=1 Tax=Phrynocephalus forsythii TaxID=171643 RepID=A0A9Q0XJT5_9SAUR|nr:hypothetical protein JRQ81_003391 [Phrynocephalus forsythii]